MQHINPNDSAVHLAAVYVSTAPLLTIDAGRTAEDVEAAAAYFDILAERAQTRQDASSTTTITLTSSTVPATPLATPEPSADTPASTMGMPLFSKSAGDERGARPQEQRVVYPSRLHEADVAGKPKLSGYAPLVLDHLAQQRLVYRSATFLVFRWQRSGGWRRDGGRFTIYA